MKLMLTALAAVFTATAVAVAAPAPRPQSVLYGHIKSMTRKAGAYEIRFDPAWWLTGRAAEQAKFEASGSRSVPNDYYVVEEGHRLLSFVVRADARVTVLTGGGDHATPISASELNAIVSGRNPNHRHLSERQAGFWIRIGAKYPSPAVSLDQQYQP
jgi:hypothetical protein